MRTPFQSQNEEIASGQPISGRALTGTGQELTRVKKIVDTVDYRKRAKWHSSTGAATWIGKVVSTAPADDTRTPTGAQYWVKEQTVSGVGANGDLTFEDTEDGLHVIATNLEERGIGTDGNGMHAILPEAHDDNNHCSDNHSVKPASGFGTSPDVRYVEVTTRTADDEGSTEYYTFTSLPLTLLETSYYLAVNGLDTNSCPDSSVWLKGVIAVAVCDADSPPA